MIALTAAACLAPALRVGAAPDDDVLPGPPTFYEWVLPLEYDGTSFRVPPSFKGCNQPWDATPYLAEKPHDVAIGQPVLFMPDCAQPAGDLYIVAQQLRTSDTGLHYKPKDSFPAQAVAGPAFAGEHPWVFKPLGSTVTLRAGVRYVFWIARIVAI